MRSRSICGLILPASGVLTMASLASPAHSTVRTRRLCETPLWLDGNFLLVHGLGNASGSAMPPLSPCLRGTFLAWVPCAFLWLAAPFEFYRMACTEVAGLKWTAASSAKLVFSASITTAHMSLLLTESSLLQEEFTGTVLKLFTLLMACTLQSMTRVAGLSSSAVQFVFWLLFSTSSAITSVSVYTDPVELKSWSRSGTIIQFFIMALSLIELGMSSFADLSRREKLRVKAPVAESSFPSRLTFQWMNPLILKGFRTTLVEDDMPPLVDEMQPRACANMMLQRWHPEVKRDHHGNATQVHHGSLVGCLIKAFAGPLLQIAALETLFCLGMFLPIYFMDALIQFGGSQEPLWLGYLYAVLMTVASVAVNLLYSQVYYFSSFLALRVKTALTACLYRKVLTAWSTGSEQRSAGEVINSITLDTEKVYQAMLFAGELWGAPLRLLLTMALLWQYLGPSCLVAVAVVLLVLVCSFFFARRVNAVQTAQMETKDRRSKYVHELFSGIKILKLYAWEEPFRQRVVDVRKKEMEMLRRIAYYFGVMNFVWNCISFLVSLVTFMTFLMVGNHSLDPVTAFVSLALFNTLRFSLLLIPDLIVGAVLCKVALARMKTFLVCEDVDSKQVGESPDEGDAVTMRQAAFSWHRDERVLLRDLSLHLPSGQLIAVVGHVGAGKTSFLSAILGELRVVSGSVDRKGKVAYVPQQAWIQNTTVRQNILLKRQYHSCFYERVVRACQLQTDLSALPAGDQTELGMRGVNLSGGQKQRISLARAVYQNADLYVMDDPLSAVDAQVCSALFHGVIGPRGLLRKKTRVLATHTLSLLPLMDMVIVLKEGQVKEVHRAPFGQRLFDKEQGLSAFLLASPASPQQQSAADAPTPGKAHVKHVHDELSFDVTAGEVSSLSMTMGKRPASQRPCPGYSNAGQLIEEEAFQIGKLEPEIYRDYVRRFGPIMFLLVLLGYGACRAFDVLSSVWMSSWSEDVLKAGLNGTLPVSTPWRLAVYGLLGVLQGASILLATLILALCGLNASGSLHDEALSRLVHAPMSFFDTTPLGRILNRFSKDLDQVDYQITIVMDSVLEQLSDVLGILLLISIYIPAFMIAVLPCAAVYIVVQKLFVRTFRQLQRLESVSRSPVFNCVAETVPGVQTIRAYAVQRGFVELSDSLLGRWVSCSFHLMAAERWLTVRLNFVGNAITLVTACLLVQGRELVGPATVGLTLLYALKVTDALNYLVRFTAELENSLIAVERLHEYTRTPTEAEWRVSPAPSPEWPQDGAVQFVNFSVRYRPDLDLVLKNINLEVHPSEKVGLVGRTGSGKSSLTLSLFRIVEAAEGRIVIDGVDIARIGLHDLRSKITIIPQDPVLFCGSLRMNVDPKCEHSDEQIWAALDKAHLKDFFENKSEKLDFLVEEEGKNLSVGQHQLICLARALLRNTKLLVLDEATASVDPETDGLLQKTIRRDFAHCTVLTVAHRLQTILDASRIVVMRAGEIKEIGVPGQLLRDPQSGFYAMAKEAGLVKEKRSSSADRVSAPLGTAN